MKTGHKYGEISVTPFGHTYSGILEHNWDSIQVKGPGFDISLLKPSLRAHLIFSPKEDFFQLKLDTAHTRIHPHQFSHEKNRQDFNFSFPDIRIPLETSIYIDYTDICIDSVGSWAVDSIVLKTTSGKSLNLSFEDINGTYIERLISGGADLSWSARFLDLNLRIVTEDKDSLSIAANAARTSPMNLSGTAELFIKDPKIWIHNKIPNKLSIESIHTNTKFSADISKGKFAYDANLKADLGEFWPLPALRANLNVQGNEKMKVSINGDLSGNEGGKIELQGEVDKNLNGTLFTSIENISAEFAFLMMPLDITLLSSKKSRDTLQIEATTRRGSTVNAKISDLFKNPRIDFTADIDEQEPWALDWCQGYLRFGSRPQIRGAFYDKKLHANVIISPLEYAYMMKADYFSTSLVLDKNGILFDNGIIRTPAENYDFTGEVLWNDSIPHTAWKVHQGNRGYAEAWISFDAKLQASAKNVRLATIPFADTSWRKGMDAIVSGSFNEDFKKNIGNADIYAEAEIAHIPLQAKIRAHQNFDSLVFDHVEMTSFTNKIVAEGSALLAYDSLQNKFSGIALNDAWLSTDHFDIPVLLASYKTPLAKGFLSGDITYRKNSGLQGNLLFTDLILKSFSENQLSIPKLNIFAEKEKLEISGDAIAGDGAWDGNIQVDIDGLLNPRRHIFASYATQNGGTAWLEGDVDSSLSWKGKAQLSGSWFLPENLGEITQTDLKAEITADPKKGFSGLSAKFYSDTTLFDSKKSIPVFPISFSGTLDNGQLSIQKAEIANDKGETVTASIDYNLTDMKLDKVDFHTDEYSIVWDKRHEVKLFNTTGHLEDSEKEFVLHLNLPSITYKLNDKTWGYADAKAHGSAAFHLPHAKEDHLVNSSITGDFFIDRAVYKNQFAINLGLNNLDKLTKMLSSFFTKIRREKPVAEKTSAKSRPTNLSIHIADSGVDSIAIVTNLAKFPLMVDLWVLGSTDHPILRGDINNSGSGFIGLENTFQFNLESFAISFQDVPWKRGSINISSVQELPYCETKGTTEDNETCPVHLDILGSITEPKPIPTANCGIDASPASLYYSVLLGCISENQNSIIDRNKVAGKIIGSVLTSTANKTLGGNYVGDIDMKLQFFSDETTSEKDSSYLMIPISLDRWVKDLNFVFGYKQDQSENPTYDQAIEAGLTYTIPAFDEKDKKDPEHYDPKLDFSGNLVSKRYVTALESDENENRIEKNIGFNYTYHFWSPCLFGIGRCPERKATEQKEETKK